MSSKWLIFFQCPSRAGRPRRWPMCAKRNRLARREQDRHCLSIDVCGRSADSNVNRSQSRTLALRGWKGIKAQSVAWSADGSHLFATGYTGALLVHPRVRSRLGTEPRSWARFSPEADGRCSTRFSNQRERNPSPPLTVAMRTSYRVQLN